MNMGYSDKGIVSYFHSIFQEMGKQLKALLAISSS